MNDKYKRTITLKCQTCSDSNFECNEDKSWIKCNRCGREYNGGYDELVELNKNEISNVKNKIAEEVKNDLANEIKKVFKANKNIKLNKAPKLCLLGLQ